MIPREILLRRTRLQEGQASLAARGAPAPPPGDGSGPGPGEAGPGRVLWLARSWPAPDGPAGPLPRRAALALQAAAALAAAALACAVAGAVAGFWSQAVPPLPLVGLAAAAAPAAWLTVRRPALAAALALLAALPFALAHAPWPPRWLHALGLEPAAAGLRALAAAAGAQWSAAWPGIAAGRPDLLPPLVLWPLLAAVVLAAAGLALAEAYRTGSGLLTFAAGAGLLVFQWGWYWEKAHGWTVGFAAAALALWGLAPGARGTVAWTRRGRPAEAPAWRWGPAMALAVVAVAWLLPSFKPAGFGELGRWLRRALPVLAQMRGAREVVSPRQPFDLASAGFGPATARLGGDVAPRPGTALELTVPPGLSGPLYLRGAVHTVYTGRGWLPPAGGGFRLEAGGRLLPGAPADPARPEVRLEVTAAGLATDSLFSVLEPVQVAGVGEYRADADRNLWAGRVVGRGRRYSVIVRLPAGGPGGGTAGPGGAGGPPGPVPGAAPGPAGFGGVPLDPAMAAYLQLPDLPELAPVQELARRLTRDSPDALAAATAVEAYLRQQYPYTLRPGAPDPDRDFVYDFLFRVRRGYCTYHSTAMAVMLRQVGIPARWVQGFAVPPAGGVAPAATGSPAGAATGAPAGVEVPLAGAHAWVEAYLPGHGWVTFDPTPRPDLPPLDHPRAAPAPVAPAAAPAPGPPAAPPDPGPDRPPVLPQVPGPLPALAAALVAVAAGAAWWRWHIWQPVAWGEPRLAVQQLFTHTARRLGALGWGPPPPMTAAEYAGALGQAFPELAGPAAAAAAAYAAARFGPPGAPLPGGDAAVAACAAFRRAAWAAARRRAGWWRWVAGALGPGRRRTWHRLSEPAPAKLQHRSAPRQAGDSAK